MSLPHLGPRASGLVVAALCLQLPCPAFASFCDDNPGYAQRDWFKGDVVNIGLPQAIQVSGGHVRVQVVDVQTTAWPDPVRVIVCHPNLPATGVPASYGAAVDCSAVGMTNVHPSWAIIWQSMDPNLSGGAPDGDQTQHFWGTFDFENGEMYSARVQTAAPSCGVRMLAGFSEAPDVILDNLGTGFQTFDGDLQTQTPDETWGWSINNLNAPSFYRPEDYRVSADPNRTTGEIWRADTPMFTLPTGTTAADYEPQHALSFDDGSGGSRGGRRLLGRLLPSRIAYGRVNWDAIWHGTCAPTGPHQGEACLPEGHPRADEPGFWDDTECDCDMECPDPSAGHADLARQIKYSDERSC